MAKRSKATAVDLAVAQIKTILKALPPEEKTTAEQDLFITAGYFDWAREMVSEARMRAARHEWALKGRKKRKSGTTKRESGFTDEELWKEKQNKSWEMMEQAHPNIPRSTMRSAVDRYKEYGAAKCKKSHANS